VTPSALLALLAEVERGTLTPKAAADRLATLPFENLGHTRVDHHRSLRAGLPEVIFAAGKTPQQTVEIFSSLAADGVDVLVTRADTTTARAVLAEHPAAVHNPLARTVALRQSPQAQATQGHIAVLCAGTSDIPVAIIVCAGMEGALPSVVGGMVGVPVIAVPTSVGYGASFAGATALLGMLNSCSPNVTVVNIDNGFGAAYTAVLIARASSK